MTLQDPRPLLAAARSGGYGIGAFNVIQIEHAEAIVEGAERLDLPVVLQVSENTAAFHRGLTGIGAATIAIAAAASVPVVVHLDHAVNQGLVDQAVVLGFTSVMFDGAKLPYEQNLSSTAQVVERCHAAGVAVEAELGEVGGKDGAHAPGVRTDPQEAAQFVAATGVDSLAVAVGTSHAMADRSAVLDLQLIAGAVRSRSGAAGAARFVWGGRPRSVRGGASRHDQGQHRHQAEPGDDHRGAPGPGRRPGADRPPPVPRSGTRRSGGRGRRPVAAAARWQPLAHTGRACCGRVAGSTRRAGWPAGEAACRPEGQDTVGSTITASRIAEVLGAVPTGLFIGGEWVGGDGAVPVEDPSNGEILAEVADAGPAQGMQALDAAVAAQQSWAATDPRHRGEILRRAFGLLVERTEELALLMTLEMGKPLAEARGEVAYGAEFFRWFSEEAVRISGRYSIAPTGGTRLLTMKQPVGPVFAITPWNFPLAMGTRKIGPALAAGCTVVIKPAAQTPLTTLALATVLTEAGVPAGVVNVVTTSRSGAVSEPIIRDPRLRKLTFTGSTAVGQRLIEQSAQQVLKISMELGGNAPFVVFADADLDRAVDGAMLAKMRNIGEACTAANRFIVHESVVAEFAARLAERMGALVVGPGIEDGVQVGPLVDAAAVEKVSELVANALDSGATVLTGAKAVGGPGHFYAPTVLTEVPPTADMFRQEIFGPVAPITTFATEDEGVALANDTEYGLVAYMFTENLTRALRVAERLETGMVGVNQGIVSNPAAPFGGVKASGLGREGGAEGIEEYLETKYVGIAL